MELEVGKYYRTRHGRKVGPLKKSDWLNILTDGEGVWNESDGTFGDRDDPVERVIKNQPELDIIAEWADEQTNATQSPVRHVTRKEIVPGVYGKVSVFKDEPHINHFIEVSDYMSRADLIAARDVFNQLIEALEE